MLMRTPTELLAELTLEEFQAYALLMHDRAADADEDEKEENEPELDLAKMDRREVAAIFGVKPKARR